MFNIFKLKAGILCLSLGFLGLSIGSQAVELVDASEFSVFDETLQLDEAALFGEDGQLLSAFDRRRPPVRPAPPHRRPPVHRPPPPRRPPPYRPAPPPAVPIICYADDGNRYGYTYYARGYHPYAVQQEAMRQCYRYSRFCYERGCERDRGW